MTLSKAEARKDERGLITRFVDYLGPWGMFLKGFARNPVMVGSVVPSSGKLIRHMLAPVDWANCKVFVEYGPGVGTFCRPVLERMAPDAMLVAIDTNKDFIDYLKREIRDSRFVPVHGSAADVRDILAALGHSHADYALSGLPFSTLPPGVGDAIADATRDAIRPGGAFLVYQFRAKVLDFLKGRFGTIDRAIEYWNVPPCHLFWAYKDEDQAR
ncbi:MAG: methyltransferase [Sphingomonadales bacterium]|nr:methyltransferase [Sphingomonadales bacterium]